MRGKRSLASRASPAGGGSTPAPGVPHPILHFGIDTGITNGILYGMKTAISVPDDIFRAVEKVAKQRRSTRSAVIVSAIREYLEHRKSGEILAALDEAYGTAETAEEYTVRRKAKRRYGRALRGERP